MIFDHDATITEFTKNNQNYKEWRKIHTKAFGRLFAYAFQGNETAQIHLTATLISVSNRQFAFALPKLEQLLDMAATPADIAVMHYFVGLCHEMMEHTDEMTEHYEALLASSEIFEYPIAFHPYFRTAKFSQKHSECSKAIYFYTRALDFYSHRELTRDEQETVSRLLYEIATVRLYMHEYDAADRLLQLSRQYSAKTDSQRDYVTATLLAVQGKQEAADALIENLPAFYQGYLRPQVEAILAGTDLHYCQITQKRSHYPKFADKILAEQDHLRELIATGQGEEAKTFLCNLLMQTFQFAGRVLECSIEPRGEKIVVNCHNYRIKTLMAEHQALFDLIKDRLPGWEFRSVCEFEHYPIDTH